MLTFYSNEHIPRYSTDTTAGDNPEKSIDDKKIIQKDSDSDWCNLKKIFEYNKGTQMHRISGTNTVMGPWSTCNVFNTHV